MAKRILTPAKTLAEYKSSLRVMWRKISNPPNKTMTRKMAPEIIVLFTGSEPIEPSSKVFTANLLSRNTSR